MSNVSPKYSQLSATARNGVTNRNWSQVSACASQLIQIEPKNPEGHFLLGLANKAANHAVTATRCFQRALDLDRNRYDAAIEIANQYMMTHRYAEARTILDNYNTAISNSPMYLSMAAGLYTRMGLHENAYANLKKAIALQPQIESFQASLAACAVYLGKLNESENIYKALLKRNPSHQKNHYELSQVRTAQDERHIKQMKHILKKGSKDPAKNIFLFYALGKELEDLGRWEEAFNYYRQAGDAVKTVADYEVESDVAVIDRIIEVCTLDWLADEPANCGSPKAPLFLVGLPRTGTTLVERILSSHSSIQNAGETQIMQMVLKKISGLQNVAGMSPEVISAAAKADSGQISKAYYDTISYRLGEEPVFIDKLPENVIYLGFIAKAWPDARIVHMRRNPMDACFAMYKQSYFRFAYSFEDLAAYYLAYDRLSRHWRELLGDRMVEVEYEQLVSHPETEIRKLLGALDFDFEDACLQFEKNTSSVATASSAQVREKIHTKSLGRWKHFSEQLKPLRNKLEQGGLVLQE